MDMIRSRAWRRYQVLCHMRRRLKEDRNQHYNDLLCPCWSNARVVARFKEQPKLCSRACCGNPRRYQKGEARFTLQERRYLRGDILYEGADCCKTAAFLL